MLKHFVIFIVFVSIAAVIGLVNLSYQTLELNKYFYTAITFAVLYFFFRIVLEGVVATQIRDAKARYTFRKTMYVLYLVLLVIVILRIWIVNPQALLVAYGMVAAGVAIALQDLFKNFAGGIVIFLTGLYRVGNRIELNGKFGDVIDVGILYTTLMEIREWIDGDQATGRLSLIPNGLVLGGVINNYTKDHQYLWDEISIPITYLSDWREAAAFVQSIADTETKRFAQSAQKSLSHLEERYFMSERTLEPVVYHEATDNWIKITVRYVVEVRQRRSIRNKLTLAILDAIEKNDAVTVASTTLSVVQMRQQA